MITRVLVSISCLLSFAGLPAAPAQRPAASAADTTTKIVAAADKLLATLDDAGKKTVLFPFDGPQKARWSNFPSGIFERQGLKLGDLNPAQKAAVMTLLQTALSADGYRKVREIMHGDEVLKTTDGGNGPRGGGGTPPPGGGTPPPGGRPGRGGGRGPGGGGGLIFGEDLYYLAFVGTPSVTTPWMLQFGGHHLAINLTMAGAQSSMTPSLPAAQPAKYTVEGREIRPLGRENDKGFALINALDASQQAQAILKFRVTDLVLGPGQDGRTIQPEGLRASSMTPAQQNMLLELVREWAGIPADAFVEPRMAEIKAALADTYFAWSGPTTNGSASYFRIQGPQLVIEYAPQGGVDHIHTIYRDPTNDYGARFVKK